MSIEQSIVPRPAWPAVPLWALIRNRNEFGGDLPLLSLSAQHGVRERVEGEGRAASEDTSGYRVVRPGDLVINRLSARDGAYAVSGLSGLVSPAYWVLQGPAHLDPRWLDYVLHTAPYAAEMRRISKVMPPAQFDLPWDQFRRLHVPVPPLKVQRAIAGFLHAETSRIDALITKKRRMINLLDERINCRIMRVIGNSELVGCREVPAAPVRRVLQRHQRWASEGEMVTAFRNGEVTTRAARGREGFTNAWTDGGRLQQVEVEDVVVHGLDGFSGAIGDAQHAGVCSPVYHVCSPLNGDGAFYGRLLRLLALDGYLGNFAVSTRERAVDFRNWDLFGRIPIPVAPRALQNEIGAQIRALRPLRQKIATSEELAKEHRQALITAAVTGELGVPGVAG